MGAGCSSTAAVRHASSPTPPTVSNHGGTSSGNSPNPPSTRSRGLFARSRERSQAAAAEQQRRRERERAEVENLQRELAAMEELFNQLLGNVFREMQEEAENAGPPPASAQAIRRLPTVVVTAEDLIDEQNRQCAVCFGDCHVGHKMTRLPCGHLFHGACVGPWLYKRCTCPVCRYEMPTDSTEYEEGRIERMRSRRPRLRRHELDRMKMRELKDLAYERLDMSSQGNALTDKAVLINQIISSGKVDVIASPEPIEYRLSDLRAMGVGKLRKEMEQAGVYFDPVDVLEKEDMVQLFLHSGRVALLDHSDSGESEDSDDAETSGHEIVFSDHNKRIIEELAFEGTMNSDSSSDC